MSINNRVLIIDQMHESIVPMLEEIGCEVNYEPSISREEILDSIGSYSGLIVRSKTSVDQELINAAHQLQFVARAGAGMDKLDTDYLRSKNITILNAPEGNRDAVGEHAMGLLLNLLNQITIANEEVKRGEWRREENRGMELKGKVVGIYGFGNTGSSFAKRLSGFSCEVLAFDKYRTNFGNELVQEVSEDEFRERVEVLSIHVPLTEETNAYFSQEELKRYPNLKIILNTARGELLPLSDVVELLENNNLSGAGLDVLENEKLDKLTESEQSVFQRLASNKNVILTPHVAGWTHESYRRINQVLVEKIRKLNLFQ